MYDRIPNVGDEASTPIPIVGDDTTLGCLQRACRDTIGYFLKFLKGSQQPGINEARHQEEIVINVHSESIRQIVYVCFWAMCLLAFLLSKLFIPKEIIEHSDLVTLFGFNNICVFWDYTPSRELTALFFPLFEYSFFAYVILDFIQTRLYLKISHPWLYRLGLWTLPVKLILIAWFRMIFVYQVNMNPPIYDAPYPNFMPRGVVGHTLGFFGLQFALILIAFQNALYVLSTDVIYPWLGRKGTIVGGWLYLVCVVYVTFFFIFTTSTILYNAESTKPPLTPLWMFLFRLSERVWMVVIAIIPLYFAQVARKTEPYVRVTLALGCDHWPAESVAGTGQAA